MSFYKRQLEKLEKEKAALQAAQPAVTSPPTPVPIATQEKQKRQTRQKPEPELEDEVEVELESLSNGSEFDEIDFEIFKLLAKKYKAKGINIVRHNMANPFLMDFSRLAYLVQDKQTFIELNKKNLVTKTRFKGQYKIR
jgi:hypothetical protein